MKTKPATPNEPRIPMKKTNTAATEPRTAPAEVPAPSPQSPAEPSEYKLLALIMERISSEEKQFLYDFLKDCSTSPLDLPVIALSAASHALGLGLFVEDITDYTEDFRGLTRVTLDDRGWLYHLLHEVFRRVNKGECLNPEDLMEMSARHLVDLENDLEMARQVIQDRPKLLAKEIRQAVAAQPALLT